MAACSHLFADARHRRRDRDAACAFQPKFDADGLIPAIVTDAASGEVLMFAWMNAEALALTLETRIGHFWSRSRGQAVEEGRGQRQRARRRRAAHRLRPGRRVAEGARSQGDGVACHTGERSCFYRSLPLGASPRRRDLPRLRRA